MYIYIYIYVYIYYIYIYIYMIVEYDSPEIRKQVPTPGKIRPSPKQPASANNRPALSPAPLK